MRSASKKIGFTDFDLCHNDSYKSGKLFVSLQLLTTWG